MKPVIYSIENIISNKIYIGSSNNYIKRWERHKSNLKHNKHDNIHLQRAWNKHGQESFKFSVIEETTKDLLLEREQHHMDKYNSYDFKCGYNINPIANRPPSPKGRIITEEYREKQRLAHLGHPVSKETKQKISKAHKGLKKPRTKEWQDSLVASRKASGKYKQTEETKEKIRQSLLGRKITETTRKKISEARKGKTSGNKDKKASEQTKLKMSIAQKNAWKKRKKNYDSRGIK